MSSSPSPAVSTYRLNPGQPPPSPPLSRLTYDERALLLWLLRSDEAPLPPLHNDAPLGCYAVRLDEVRFDKLVIHFDDVLEEVEPTSTWDLSSGVYPTEVLQELEIARRFPGFHSLMIWHGQNYHLALGVVYGPEVIRTPEFPEGQWEVISAWPVVFWGDMPQGLQTEFPELVRLAVAPLPASARKTPVKLPVPEQLSRTA